MFYEIGKYGGFITIILAWLTLVFPFLLLRGNKKWKYLSEAAIKGFWGTVFKIGVILCGVLQIFFSYFLYQNFSRTLSEVGVIMYGLASLSFLLCGLITYYRKRRIHKFFLTAYFVLMSLGFLLISFELTIVSKILAVLLIVVPVYLEEFRRADTAFDIVTIILSNLFALSVYQSLGIINFV